MAESYIGPSPRNPYTGALSDALASAKKFGNEYEIKNWVPLIGGTSLGDLFLGGSPELIDDVSYQGTRGLIKGGNEATGGIGTYTLDPRVADAAMVGADMYGVGKLGTYGAKKAVGKAKETLTERLLREELNNSRREFLKSGAKGAAIAAAGAGGVAAARKFSKEAAPKVADNAALQATKKYRFNSLKEYLDSVWKQADSEASEIYRAQQMEVSGSPLLVDEYADDTDILRVVREKLIQDELDYNTAKNKLRTSNTENKEMYKRWTEEFSPQAKEQMKAYKKEADIHGADWTNFWWEGQ